MSTTRRPTKAEVKRARLEAARTAAAQAQRRARNIRLGLWSVAATAIVAVVVAAIAMLDQPSAPPTPSPAAASPKSSPAPAAAKSDPAAGPASSAPGRTGNPPWNAPLDASAAVAAAGLPMLGEEGNALHFHAHLDIIVNGTPVKVPADIGVDEARQKISPLHSHDASGVIHIESPTKSATFTLGQFFAEWQVSLSADHIGGLAVDDTHHLKVYVNGVLRGGDPTGIVLAGHDEIAIVYGTDAQQTNVPSTYEWSNGL